MILITGFGSLFLKMFLPEKYFIPGCLAFACVIGIMEGMNHIDLYIKECFIQRKQHNFETLLPYYCCSTVISAVGHMTLPLLFNYNSNPGILYFTPLMIPYVRDCILSFYCGKYYGLKKVLQY